MKVTSTLIAKLTYCSRFKNPEQYMLYLPSDLDKIKASPSKGTCPVREIFPVLGIYDELLFAAANGGANE